MNNKKTITKAAIKNIIVAFAYVLIILIIIAIFFSSKINKAISVIITLITIFLFAFIVTYTNFPETAIASVIIGITTFSILIGSSISSVKLNKNGMLNGGIIGFLYMIFLYLISSSLGTGFSLNLNAIIMMIFGIVAGMIGGIVGVNIKK